MFKVNLLEYRLNSYYSPSFLSTTLMSSTSANRLIYLSSILFSRRLYTDTHNYKISVVSRFEFPIILLDYWIFYQGLFVDFLGNYSRLLVRCQAVF